MAKNTIIIVSILVLILLVTIYFFFLNKPPLNTISVDLNGQKFNLEVANTIPQKTLGLGKRTSLCEKCGMLFIWSFSQPLAFWMKDTLIPLDIIFINKDHQIVDIYTAYPEPGVSDLKLKIYSSSQPSQYVIELNAGTATKLKLSSGDVIKF